MNTKNKCVICGEVIEEGLDFCDKHMDEAFVLLMAIMKAESMEDFTRAWQTWRNGQDGRKKTTFLDNCHNCGRLMWVWPWERKNGHHGGWYCCKECLIEANQGKTKDEVSSFFKEEIFKSEVPKNPDAVALGRLGGLKGGRARAQKLSRKRRSEIASNAAKARWEKTEKKTPEALAEIVDLPKLDTNSRCPKCGTKTLERDGEDLHCWACGHIIYCVFSEAEKTAVS